MKHSLFQMIVLMMQKSVPSSVMHAGFVAGDLFFNGALICSLNDTAFMRLATFFPKSGAFWNIGIAGFCSSWKILLSLQLTNHTTSLAQSSPHHLRQYSRQHFQVSFHVLNSTSDPFPSLVFLGQLRWLLSWCHFLSRFLIDYNTICTCCRWQCNFMMWMMMYAVLLILWVITRQGGITIWIVNIVLEVFPLSLACMMKDMDAALFTTYVVWGHVVNFATYRTHPSWTKLFITCMGACRGTWQSNTPPFNWWHLGFKIGIML